MTYTIQQIADILGANVIGNSTSMVIDRLLTDSRSLCFPESTLFFALKTSRADGHRYISQLYNQGVRAFVVERVPSDVGDIDDSTIFLQVKNTRKALQRLAAMHRQRFEIPVIGITGSNGKTIVKEWLYQLLASEYRVTRSPKSYNSQIGVPLSVWLMDERTELGIFEAGISEKGEMDALQNILHPTIGVFTSIGGAHQENFDSTQDKCMEKLTLFKDCDVIIYNSDNELIGDCISKSPTPAGEIAWSVKDDDKPLYISSISRSDSRTCIQYRYLGISGEYSIPFIDDASIEDSIHCLAVCLYLMLPQEQIAERMMHLEPVAMRLEVKEGRHGCTIINDSYNSDLNSLDIALDFVARRPDRKERKHTLVLSDILETGQTPKMLYRKVAGLVATRKIDKIIGVGPEISAQASLFPIEGYFFPSTEEFLASEVFSSFRDEIILLKGARRFHFDSLAELLELKVHETILEIDLGAVVDNLNYYRNFLKKDVKIICMVKASAYGAGSYEIAKTLQDHQVDYLAVAVADEGVELRKAGISCPIIIMNPELTAFKTMFDYRLEPEVYSFKLLDELIKAAGKEGITNFPIHIKIDTGMHRLGFLPEEVSLVVERLMNQSSVVPRSVFSHFVGSDSPNFDEFSHQQFALLTQSADILQEAFPHKILRHICNSAAIQRFPEAQLDMVRLGLGLYGVCPIDNTLLSNVSTLKTTILQIHDVPAGDTVGYSRRGKITTKSRIATLPIGYADGLNRRLGNGHACCLVNGHRAPYVGNICMDVCMIDVTGIDCQEGDSVIVFGKDLPVTELSDILETIPYEILTSVSNRVKRIYFQD